MAKQNIVIVGGGAAGVAAAKILLQSLDASQYQTILINALPYRIWPLASLRLTVSHETGYQEQVMLPYDKIFIDGKPGRFVHGTVKSFEATEDSGKVTLESGETIEYAFLILAQGASWSGPPNFPRTESGVKTHINELQTKFSNANDIVLVGGGAVGYELAGEIKDIWPDKKITIVHGDKLLLNAAYPDKVRLAAEAGLRARGVDILLREYIDFAETKEIQGISTRSGRELKNADFIVQTRGTRPNTEFVAASIGAASLNGNGLIRVRPTLQLADYENIFAAGDVIDWKEQKQFPKARAHGEIAATNVLAILQQRPLKSYKGSTEMIVITNGKGGGLSYFDVLWGIMLGNWFARWAKSKTLMLPAFKDEQGY
ncbi:FAD/NAD(P)-binding domain-containing protein [Collybia nuda]|uniref:FAD/NAD(P)-binding domain-containing protein n=1 Tax=Collybia nuda TaxID=64659 RepID=A0A9P6C8L0_9AGAR|nr:FAD/NAD(P)-binding domain-containing protein [Collybia nuda]